MLTMARQLLNKKQPTKKLNCDVIKIAQKDVFYNEVNLNFSFTFFFYKKNYSKYQTAPMEQFQSHLLNFKKNVAIFL